MFHHQIVPRHGERILGDPEGQFVVGMDLESGADCVAMGVKSRDVEGGQGGAVLDAEVGYGAFECRCGNGRSA